MKRNIIYLLLALVIALPASAQKLYNDAISLSDVSLWQQGNSLYISMTIDMKNLVVSPQRSLTLTPLLTDGPAQCALTGYYNQRPSSPESIYTWLGNRKRKACRYRYPL